MHCAVVREFWESAQKSPGGHVCAARRCIRVNPILGVGVWVAWRRVRPARRCRLYDAVFDVFSWILWRVVVSFRMICLMDCSKLCLELCVCDYIWWVEHGESLIEWVISLFDGCVSVRDWKIWERVRAKPYCRRWLNLRVWERVHECKKLGLYP